MTDDVIKAYFKFMVDTAVLLGAENNEAEQQMREVLYSVHC